MSTPNSTRNTAETLGLPERHRVDVVKCKGKTQGGMQIQGPTTMSSQDRRLNRWIALQRERALTLLALRKLNEKLEDIRPALRNLPLDGYSIELGGTDQTPGVSGLWLEHYLAAP